MTGLLISLVLLLVLLGAGLWIAFSMGAAAGLALWLKVGDRLFYIVGLQAWQVSTKWVLIALPLFILMGEILSQSGVANKLYLGLSKFLKGVPGGLVQTNIAACAIFAAMSGTSIAGAATMGALAYEEMVKRFGYDKYFVLGSVAAGGTLGILIPPSIVFVIYGELAQQSIGALFLAGVFPGLMLSGLFMLYIGIVATLRPQLTGGKQVSQKISLRERLFGLLSVWPFALLILTVLGVIYLGIATPTEAAAVGVVGAIVLSICEKLFSWRVFKRACLSTVRTTSMCFLLITAAQILSLSIAYYGVPGMLQSWARGVESPAILLLAAVILYTVMGCFFDSLSMMLLTLPFVLPVMRAVGFDLIWFGIIVTILFEVGVITPPFGINLFILQGITGEPIMSLAKGCFPYVLIMMLGVAIVLAFPPIALWLPSTMVH